MKIAVTARNGTCAFECEAGEKILHAALRNGIALPYECATGTCVRDPSAPPMEGGPSWIHSESYQINARAEDAPSEGVMMGPMMQGLLEDRFRLKIRGSDYTAWVDGDGRMVRVQGLAPKAVPVVLEGFEDATRGLKP